MLRTAWHSWIHITDGRLTWFDPMWDERFSTPCAGVGHFTALLEPLADQILAAELSPLELNVLRERFAGSTAVSVAQIDLETGLDELPTGAFDTATCLDVAEHIEDDVALFRRLLRLVEPGGHLIVKVPACPALYGPIDVASSHHRRYSPGELRRKAALAGWEPIMVRYMNIAGVLPYWFKCKVLKRQSNFSTTFSPRQLRMIRRVVPLLRVLDRLTGPVIGQSALMAVRRPP